MKETYTYKEKQYYIESTAEMKDPTSRAWIPAVVYVSKESGERYVREAVEFFEKFEDVKSRSLRLNREFIDKTSPEELESLVKDFDEMAVFGAKEVFDSPHKKEKQQNDWCTCPCHTDRGVIHAFPCCNNGIKF